LGRVNLRNLGTDRRITLKIDIIKNQDVRVWTGSKLAQDRLQWWALF
jgi:hypothetical protein